MLYTVAFMALVLGIKFMLIAAYGNVTPYWDQWDAEIDQMFRPWVEGHLQWSSLLSAHNEHRVFTGRVLALLIFVLNGNVLNPMIETVVNAILHTSALLLLLHALLKMLPDAAQRLPAALVVVLIFAAPLGVENILINNSALYFLILFGILFLIAIARDSRQGMTVWFISVLATGLMGCLSFASGIVSLAVGVVMLAVQWLSGVRRNNSTLVMIALLIVMIVVALHFTPAIPGHSSYKSRSIIDFAIAILAMTGGFVFYIPSFIFMYRQLHKKPPTGDSSWFLFGLFLWIFGQMVIIAYGRGHSNVLTSRYFDLYAIGFVANFIALLVNMKDKEHRWSLKLFRIWLVLLFIGIGVLLPKVARNLENMKVESCESESRVRVYLDTHDRHVLDEPEAKIPYPDPVRLKLLLDQQVVRSMLPSLLTGSDKNAEMKAQTTFSKVLFFTGSILAGLGSGLLCSGLIDSRAGFCRL